MHRKQKVVARIVRDCISDIIMRDLKDPRVGIVAVTFVDLSGDLRHARIRLSVIGDTEEAMDESFAALESAKPFIRKLLGERVRLRHVPDLTLERDRGAEHAQKIDQLLAEIKSEKDEGSDDDSV